MSVQYNMKPLPALQTIYGSITDGFTKNDFELNENSRGIVVPFLLKEFLSKYAYLPVNRQGGSLRFFHPNLMTVMKFAAGKTELSLLCIGRIGEFQIAVKNEASEDPRIFLIKLDAQGKTKVLPSDDIVSELIKVMICNLLLTMKSAVIADKPEDAVRLLIENGVDLDKIEYSPKLSREYSLNFSEETHTFAVAELVKGEFVRFFFVKNNEFRIETKG